MTTTYFILCLLAVISSCSCLTCAPGHSIAPLSSGCYHILHNEVTKKSRITAENQCRILGEPPYQWHLPKVDTPSKNRLLREAVYNITGLEEWMAYLDLRRDPPNGYLEATNLTQWRNKSKWRWAIDGTTLETFAGGSPPWIDNEPSNGLYTDSADPDDLELCVVASMEEARGPLPKWFDMSCEMRASHFHRLSLDDYVLVCESSLDTSDDKPVQQAIKSVGSGSPHPWKWLFWVAAVITLALGASLAGALYYIRKIRHRLEMSGLTVECHPYEDISGSRVWIVGNSHE